MSEPLSRMRPRVGSWKRATRSVTVVLPAPLRPTSATTDPPGTVTLKSRTTGCPSRYSNSTSSKRISCTTRGASRASGRSGLSSSIASTSNTRSIAASDRCSSENELTMFQTGFSSRNVYHWNAMMSPIDARPMQVEVPAVPDDHDVDRAEQEAPGRPEHQLAAVREELLAQHRVPAAHVVEELAHLAAERAHDANPRERLADAPVDQLGVLPHRAVDGPDAPREGEADQHHAGNDRERRQREPPVQRASGSRPR